MYGEIKKGPNATILNFPETSPKVDACNCVINNLGCHLIWTVEFQVHKNSKNEVVEDLGISNNIH